jgi:hypothetical protein
MRIGLDPAAHLEPVEPGQHHVQHDHVRRVRPRRLDRGRAVRRDADREALGAQPDGDRVGDGPLVLDDQHPPLARCVHARHHPIRGQEERSLG